MVEVLWRHGPSMLEQMRAKKIPWPRFAEGDLGHLVAFLNANPADIK